MAKESTSMGGVDAEDGMEMSLEQIYDNVDLPLGREEGVLHGRRFKCLSKEGTKFYNCCLALVAITLGSTLATSASFLAIENYKKNNYIAFAACLAGDVIATVLILAGGWKIKKTCCKTIRQGHNDRGQDRPNPNEYDDVEMIEV